MKQRSPMILRINREGEFSIIPRQNHTSQCGKHGARKYKYFVSIEASNRSLTPEGFLMDNAECERYFHNRYVKRREKCRSCEDMAQEAVEYFLRLFKRRPELKRVDLLRVYVRIHGAPVSYIEAEWKSPTEALTPGEISRIR